MGFQVRFNCCELSWSVASGEGPVAIFFCQTSIKTNFMIPFSSPGFDQLRLASAGHDSAAVWIWDLSTEQLFKQHCDKLDFQANWLRNLFSQAHTCLLLKKTLNMSLSLFLPLSSLFLCQLGNKQNGIWSTNKGDILGKRGDSHKTRFHSNWQPAHFPSLKMLKRIHTRRF